MIFVTPSFDSFLFNWIMSSRSSDIPKLAIFPFLFVSALSLVARNSAFSEEEAYAYVSEKSMRSHHVIKGNRPINPYDALGDKKVMSL